MSSNRDHSKKILKILAENKALSVPDLTEKMAQASSAQGSGGLQKGQKLPAKERYAMNRALRGLAVAGLVESHFSGQNDYARLTPAGRRKAMSQKLEADDVLVPNWDGQWRIVMLDLPESRKSERESLRYLLKKAGFVMLKNSAWISPFPLEHLFMNIKKDLGLSTEMMVFVTNQLDEETEKLVLENFKK